MNHEFVGKIIQAKKLEMQAIGSLLPEPVKGHIDVINRELTQMAKEIIFSCSTGSEKSSGPEREHKTNKVDIE